MKPHHHQKRNNQSLTASSPILFGKIPHVVELSSSQQTNYHNNEEVKSLTVSEEQSCGNMTRKEHKPRKSRDFANRNVKKHADSKNKRKLTNNFVHLPCELVLHIVEYLEFSQFIHIFLLCKNLTNKLNENSSQFYKLLLIRIMKSDISSYRRYLEERTKYNSCPFSFDIKSTCFKARGIVQWKRLIEKREHELDNHLNKKRKELKDWKQVYDGYSRRRSIEHVMFRVKTVSKACWKNDKSLILVLKMITQLREKLLKLDPELRKYIVQRNYGKRIKRGHTLFHQIVYLIGNYSEIRYDYESIQPFVPHLKFLIGCCGEENPLFTRNSYNYSGMDYIVRIGSYALISEMVYSYSHLLKGSDLSTFERKPFLFSMIKNKIASTVIKNWIQKFEFPKSSLTIRNHLNMNILHYLMHFVFKYGTQDFSQFVYLLKSELSEEQVLAMLKGKDDLDETPMSKLLSMCENNQRNSRVGIINWKNLKRLYGLVNMMAIRLGYDMSSEELDRWNNLLRNNDEIFGDSCSKFHLSEGVIEMMRKGM
ncbi:hypothetical protein NAEGRDRAFT_70222 [Naegleria gruberi]|uniref:F-box domain-containing protein n=1 Tax=Naegleria gruberi TaxID=5762 RepID=D2VMQ5_NAEGR|nr:uncharacterized protein NAEGRDRAFT_70222 [Naegleria gruberi]EFC41774.1 hypothetical protein NAEGRDRAFT_70222 [Naegleria gruberi]|eukprot:XP_002674518.1 hypothetical protein NAEGRDRAFT_70222 [Naegleria gruberi strain NEG-M]